MTNVKSDGNEYDVLLSRSVKCKDGNGRRSVQNFKNDVLNATLVYEAIFGEMPPTYDDDEKILEGNLADAAYDKAMKALRELWGFDAVIHTLTSTGHKISEGYTGPFVSFRFIIRGAGKFRCGADMVRAGKVPAMFDQSIYKKEGRRQLLRVWGASKEGENRPMKYLLHGAPKTLQQANAESPELATFLFENMLAQNVGTEKLIEVDSEPEVQLLIDGESIKAVGANGKVFGEDIKIESVEQMQELCRIGDWFEQKWEWQEWVYRMWLLRNAANECKLDLRELAHKVSQISSKYLEEG